MLELFEMETCPYCRKVMDYLEENNIEFVKKEIGNQKNHDELIKLGGKEQVPFLVDTEKNTSMYDSEDIIEYLKYNYVNKG